MGSIEQGQIQITAKIKEIAKGISPSIGPIWDGVSDASAYETSSPRIAWILKEAYDEEPGETGWSHPDFLAGKSVDDINTGPTWKRVNEVMYAIRRRCHVDDSVTVDGNYLKDIAWINLNKMPGKSLSDDQFKKQFKKFWSGVVKDQIDLYQPEILLFGNTLPVCQHELFPEGVVLKEKRPLVYIYTSLGRLLIHAYHPGWWGVTDVDYVNAIVDAIADYYTIPDA